MILISTFICIWSDSYAFSRDTYRLFIIL